MPDSLEPVITPPPVTTENKTDTQPVFVGSAFSMQLQSHEGPLPSPAVAEAYETMCPGATDRILQLAEKEQHHRLVCEEKALTANIEDTKAERMAERRGQWQAFALCFLSIASGVVLALTGQPVPGTLLAGVTMLGIAAVFITRKVLPPSISEK